MVPQRNNLNPFSNYGAIVFGSDFVGRESAIQTIRERVINADEPGCISIVGLPRIGKSSLVWHTLIAPQSEMLGKNKLVVWISMGTFRTPEEFFRHLVLATLEAAEDANILTEDISKIGRAALEGGLAWIDFQGHIRRFIKRFRKLGWRLIYVIDEFDAARTVFKDNLFAYQYLRELHNNPEHRICYVTTSRRTISEIEFVADISNLNGIFHQLYLGLFNVDEFDKQFDKLSKQGIAINNVVKTDITNFTGLHPYLNAILGFHFAEQWLGTQSINFEEACGASRSIFHSYYEHLISDHLRQENSLGKFIDLVNAPIQESSLGLSEKYKLLELIKVSPSGIINVFSRSFLEYLKGTDHPTNDFTLIQKGQLLGSKYRVLRILKTTNHSQVAEAWEEKLERKVAIKCLYLSKSPGNIAEQLKNNLEREGRILADLKHPNIGAVYNTIDDPVGIVMEWIDGRSLQDYLNDRIVFDIPAVLRIGIIIADSLAHAHSHKIIHRDVKPGNIILTALNEPILVDFDIARIINRETISLTKDGRYDRLGTARYSAPEQINDPERITPAVDVFSLGMVLYELMRSEIPRCWGNDPGAYEDDLLPAPEKGSIPDDFYAVLCKMLDQDPKKRPTAILLKEQLEMCL